MWPLCVRVSAVWTWLLVFLHVAVKIMRSVYFEREKCMKLSYSRAVVSYMRKTDIKGGKVARKLSWDPCKRFNVGFLASMFIPTWQGLINTCQVLFHIFVFVYTVLVYAGVCFMASNSKPPVNQALFSLNRINMLQLFILGSKLWKLHCFPVT